VVSRVQWVGAQRDVLAGDLRPRIELAELAHLRHLYAVGPLAGLAGEISVFDGTPVIARVVNGNVVVDREENAGACFLVYADVPAWRWTTMEAPLADGDTASHVVSLAREADAPLVFVLKGVAPTLTFHVLDKRDGLPHSPELHERAKVRSTLRDQSVEVVGFHSTRHRGVFTPGDSPIHMHFRTADSRWSGHVERLELAPGWTLGLPAGPEQGQSDDARSTS
jgi:Alpha-acetolactate decarboxylase